MREIKAAVISDAVRGMCISAAYDLPGGTKRKIEESLVSEDWPPAKSILERIIENYELAADKSIPICQDTGAALVFVEIGQDVFVSGDLNEAINDGVRRGFRDGYLRASIVADPLRRSNTNDNTPAMIHYDIVPGSVCKITIALKGFGSENMSRIAMLAPGDGYEGVRAFVLRAVEEAGGNPCPPIVVGVGIGGSFDKAALLAKKALLRPLDDIHTDKFYADMEDELLEAINALGVGPQGLGGRTTALAVKIEVMPTHIVSLPVAVNINCYVSRTIREEL